MMNDIFKKLLNIIGIKYEIKFSKTDYLILLFLILFFIIYLYKEIHTIKQLSSKIEIVSDETYCADQVCIIRNEELECFKLPKPEYYSLKIYKNLYTNTETYQFVFEPKNKQCE